MPGHSRHGSSVASGPRRLAAALAVALLAAFAAALPVGRAAAQTVEPLAGRVTGSGTAALVVVLHGDLSDGSHADYHQPFAEAVAQANRGTVAVALIRPGYRDSRGLQSPGSNNSRSDHYTRRNNDLVAATIRNLKAATGARRVIAVGHSGGAAQVGAVIGRYPGLIDSAILVSCPCNIGAWRAADGRRPWTASESPDSNTRPDLAQGYVAQAAGRGLAATVQIVPGAGHGFNGLSNAAAAAVAAEIRR